MAPTAPQCPDRIALARFAAGLATPAEADRVAAHLAACAACAVACETLPPDPLERELRGLPDDADGLSPECAELIRRVHDTTGHGPAAAAPDTCSGLSAEVSTEPDGGAAPPPGRLGRYRLVRRIGSGGMGTVHEAVDELLGRRVALKIPHAAVQSDPVARARFEREARSAAAVDHPGVCSVLDVGQHEGTSFIAMPLLDGESLAARLARPHRLPLAEALRIVRALAAAVDAIHAAGIVHRDIKPGNVFLTGCGGVVLMDFGIAAAAVGPAAAADRLTQAGATLGTVAYAAPEQAAGDWEQVGPAADVWAVGVVLHELLTGTTPFTGPPGRVIADILHREPARPVPLDPACDRRLVAICLEALAKDPRRRPARAGVIADRIAAWEAARAGGDGPRATRVKVLALAGTVVAAIIALWLVRGGRVPAPVGGSVVPGLAGIARDGSSAVAAAGAAADAAAGSGPDAPGAASPTDATAGAPAGALVVAPVDAPAPIPLPTVGDGWALEQLAGPDDVFRPVGAVRPGGILRVAASADGRTVALLHDGPGASLWDVATGGRTRWMLLPPFDTTLTLLPDGSGLLTAGGGWRVRTWSLATGLETASLAGHTNWINTIAVTGDGRRAVSSSKDGSLRGWDIAAGQPSWQEPQGRWVRCCAVSADGTRAACGTQDGFVRLVATVDGRPAGSFRAALEPVVALAFAASDSVVVTADLAGRLVAWDLATGTKRWERACRPLGSLVVAPAGDLVASTGAEGWLELLTVADGAVVAALPAGGPAADWLAAGFRGQSVLAVRRDGRIVTLAGP